MKNKSTVLITGASGQLGQELQVIAKKNQSHNFIFTNHQQLPIENEQAVNIFFQNNKIDVCINCAAYTAVDRAETDQEKAFLINATGVKNLAKAGVLLNTRLIHISTDYVFDGKANRPYRETDTTNPLSVYGKSKLLGEKQALQYNPNTIIIRTSWLYSHFGSNFVKTMIRLLQEKESIGVVNDQYGSPTYAADLAEAILTIIGKKVLANKVFHFCNEGAITWYQFAMAIKKLIKSNCKINPISTAEYPTTAIRPPYSVLDTTLIKKEFQLNIPNWHESLNKCIAMLSIH